MSAQKNITNDLYHLDVERNGWNSFGDSLHHTSMLFSMNKLKGFPMWNVYFRERMKRFVISSGELVRYPLLVDHAPPEPRFIASWWTRPYTITRDQTMAFVTAAWIYGELKQECRVLFYSLVRECFRFPNKRRNVTLEVKPWWERDIIAPDTLGLFYRATGLWYLWPFKILADFFLPIEALINALNKEKSDHVKFVVKVLAMLHLENSLLAKLASLIFVNLRKNSENMNHGKGHPVLDNWYHYWNPEAGHAEWVYRTHAPVLEKWIDKFNWKQK